MIGVGIGGTSGVDEAVGALIGEPCPAVGAGALVGGVP